MSTDLESREEAEACAGSDILIEAEERVELPEGRYWIDDLVGLRAEDAEGHALGVVTDFLPGANELYEIQGPDGRRHYIPAVEDFIREIDIEKGVLRVSLIDGLWD